MKFIYYPYRPFMIGQYFGQSNACTENNTLPISQRKVVSKQNGVCPTGFVELYPLLGMRGHTGMDLYAVRGSQPLRASIKGIVVEISYDMARGLGVGILSTEKIDLGEHGTHYVKVRQWHLHSIDVKLGQVVEPWTPIGIPDSTGLSSGDHNHFEVKPVEIIPTATNEDTLLKNIFQDNGYYGAINPEPYFNGIYADTLAPKLEGTIFNKLLAVLKGIK